MSNANNTENVQLEFHPDNNNTTNNTTAKRWGFVAEDWLRKKFLKEARENCKDKLNTFAKCAQEANLLVAFKCKDLLHTANDCVKQYSTDEKYEAYKKEYKDEMIRQGKLLPDNHHNKKL